MTYLKHASPPRASGSHLPKLQRSPTSNYRGFSDGYLVCVGCGLVLGGRIVDALSGMSSVSQDLRKR